MNGSYLSIEDKPSKHKECQALRAEMPQVDQSVSQEFHSKMVKTDSLKTNEEPFKLVFPSKGKLRIKKLSKK